MRSFFLLHLGLGSCTDLENCYAACELSKTLLELLAVEVGGSGLDSAANLSNTGLDSLAVACAADDDGVLLVDLDLSCSAELLHGGILKLKSELVGDDLTACQDSDIAEHLLAAVAEAGRLNATQVRFRAAY